MEGHGGSLAEASPAVAQADAPDAPAGKTTLTLGGIGLRNSALASLVHNFNAENTKYTVVIDDYAENTQSREQAETVMQTKLFAGDAADIYYFRNDMLSPLPWISAGLLYDLDPLIASDSEIRLNEKFAKPLQDGKLGNASLMVSRMVPMVPMKIIGIVVRIASCTAATYGFLAARFIFGAKTSDIHCMNFFIGSPPFQIQFSFSLNFWITKSMIAPPSSAPYAF